MRLQLCSPGIFFHCGWVPVQIWETMLVSPAISPTLRLPLSYRNWLGLDLGHSLGFGAKVGTLGEETLAARSVCGPARELGSEKWVPKRSPAFAGPQEASRDWAQSPPQSSTGLLQGRIRGHSWGGGEAEHQTQAPGGVSGVMAQDTTFPASGPAAAGKCLPPARLGFLLGAGHAAHPRLAHKCWARRDGGMQCGLPLHKQLRPLEPHSSVAAGHPLDTQALIPTWRCGALWGLEAEPDLTPALVSPSLHGNIIEA